jgi:transcriptional regulator with XRE-family HTH domain
MSASRQRGSKAFQRLANEAELSGRSVRELAAAAGVSPASVDRWKKLEAQPSLSAAAAFAEALGLRLELIDLGNAKPCGHPLPLPGPGVAPVRCRDCGKAYRWVPVEVEG